MSSSVCASGRLRKPGVVHRDLKQACNGQPCAAGKACGTHPHAASGSCSGSSSTCTGSQHRSAVHDLDLINLVPSSWRPCVGPCAIYCVCLTARLQHTDASCWMYLAAQYPLAILIAHDRFIPMTACVHTVAGLQHHVQERHQRAGLHSQGGRLWACDPAGEVLGSGAVYRGWGTGGVLHRWQMSDLADTGGHAPEFGCITLGAPCPHPHRHLTYLLFSTPCYWWLSQPRLRPHLTLFLKESWLLRAVSCMLCAQDQSKNQTHVSRVFQVW